MRDQPEVAVRVVSQTDGRLSHGFSSINSATELNNGRLLVSDTRDGAVLVADFETDSVAPVSERGEGPLQYLNPGRLYRFHDDTTLHVDLLAKRWLFIVGSTVVAQSSPDDPLLANGSMVFGVDRLGRVAQLVTPALTPGGSTIEITDSSSIVLVDRTTQHRDSAVRLRPTPPKPESFDFQPYFLGEQAFLAPDGWLVVVRLEPYRVDWRSPTGEWTRGPALPVDEVTMNGAERTFFGNLTGATRYGADWEDRFQWPETVPAVSFQAEWLVGSDGHILLNRQRHSRMPEPTYDRIDRTGALVERVSLATNQRIIALGRRHAYVATTDADGLILISRHPWQ